MHFISLLPCWLLVWKKLNLQNYLNSDVNLRTGGDPYCFRIHWQVYHRMSEVAVSIPNPKYARLYFIEAEQACLKSERHNANRDCKRYLMDGLDQEVRQVNLFARMYINMRQVYEREQREVQEEERPQVAVSMVIHGDQRTRNQRRYNSTPNRWPRPTK